MMRALSPAYSLILIGAIALGAAAQSYPTGADHAQGAAFTPAVGHPSPALDPAHAHATGLFSGSDAPQPRTRMFMSLPFAGVFATGETAGVGATEVRIQKHLRETYGGTHATDVYAAPAPPQAVTETAAAATRLQVEAPQSGVARGPEVARSQAQAAGLQPSAQAAEAVPSAAHTSAQAAHLRTRVVPSVQQEAVRAVAARPQAQHAAQGTGPIVSSAGSAQQAWQSGSGVQGTGEGTASAPGRATATTLSDAQSSQTYSATSRTSARAVVAGTGAAAGVLRPGQRSAGTASASHASPAQARYEARHRRSALFLSATASSADEASAATGVGAVHRSTREMAHTGQPATQDATQATRASGEATESGRVVSTGHLDLRPSARVPGDSTAATESTRQGSAQPVAVDAGRGAAHRSAHPHGLAENGQTVVSDPSAN